MTNTTIFAIAAFGISMIGFPIVYSGGDGNGYDEYLVVELRFKKN
jgi:hypothetical protein